MSHLKLLIVSISFFTALIMIPGSAYSLAISQGDFQSSWSNSLFVDFDLDISWNASAAGYGEEAGADVDSEKEGRFTASANQVLDINLVRNLDYYLMLEDGDSSQRSTLLLDETLVITNDTTGDTLFADNIFSLADTAMVGPNAQEMSMVGGLGAANLATISYSAGDVISWRHSVWATAGVINGAASHTSVPEPSSILFLGTCIAGLAGFRRRSLNVDTH